MVIPIILASGSSARAQMLTQAGLTFEIARPQVDEDAIKRSLSQQAASSRDIAGGLAEAKARKVSGKCPGALVIGCDQVLDFGGRILSKPTSPAELIGQLKDMRGKPHKLLSAVVVCEDGQPVWRHVAQVRLHVRDLSDRYIDAYVARNWDRVRDCVGGYKLEEEGVRLFARIEGDYFTVLGMPLLDLLNYLAVRGVIEQ